MELTSSNCAVDTSCETGLFTYSELALALIGVFIIGYMVFYVMSKKHTSNYRYEWAYDIIAHLPKKLIEVGTTVIDKIMTEKQTEKTLERNFSLLLIIASDKLKEKVEISKITEGDYNQYIQMETIKSLINTSRYFHIEDDNNSLLSKAKVSDELPDLEKDNLFILKITGQGEHDIAMRKTKLGLRDSITSGSCKIEKVFHLLDTRIAEKFIPTI